MDIEKLPTEVKDAIEGARPEQVPLITPREVEELFRKVNTNKSMTKGDMLPVLYKASIKTLKHPISILYNKVARSGQWPQRWKVENSFIRKKVPNPKSLDDVRAISKSPLLCNQFE